MSAGSTAYPEWAVRPGAVRSNAKGERILVGARQADGRVDVWAWRMGGWHKRRPQDAERVLKAYPVEGESGLPVPTVSPSPAWAPVDPLRPDALKVAKADNAALLGSLRASAAELTRLRDVHLPHYEDKIGEPDAGVTAEATAVSLHPHPGAALLERLRALETALADAAQDLDVWATIPSVPEGIQRALAKRAESIRALLSEKGDKP